MESDLFEAGEHRCIKLGKYLCDNTSTVRRAATHFGISKSTVHKDLSERLKKVDPALYAEVRKILDLNKAERHLRGGEATKRKYETNQRTKERGLHNDQK